MTTEIVSNTATDTFDTAELNVTTPEVLELVSTSTAVDSTKRVKNYIPRKQYELEISKINTDPNQPRKEFDDVDLQELADSIKRHGVLQPVLFNNIGGKLVLISGERRFQASKLAQKDTIPGIYIDGDDNAEIALVENLLRVDLTTIEEAEALKRLQDEKKYTNKQLAEVIGKSQSTISEILKLNMLPKKLRDQCRGDRNVSRRKWLEIAKSDDPKEIQKLYKKLLKNASRDELRAGRATPRVKAGSEVVLKKAIDGLTTMLGSVNLAEIDAAKSQDLVGALELLALEVNRITEELWNVMPKSSARRM